MARGCVRDSGRRIYRPVVSDFDQGGGSGVDEPGTSNPNRVPVFFTCPESPEIGPFLPVQKVHFSLLTCAESAEFIPFLPAQKVQFSTAVLTVLPLLAVKKIARDDVTQIHPIGAMVQGY